MAVKLIHIEQLKREQVQVVTAPQFYKYYLYARKEEGKYRSMTATIVYSDMYQTRNMQVKTKISP